MKASQFCLNSLKPVLLTPFSAKFSKSVVVKGAGALEQSEKEKDMKAALGGESSSGKLKALRELMSLDKYNLKAYFIPSEDAHQVCLLINP